MHKWVKEEEEGVEYWRNEEEGLFSFGEIVHREVFEEEKKLRKINLTGI